MSRNVCYTVPCDVPSLHALTLWSTLTLSFQYKCHAATCIVYIMEWATPSLTVWLAVFILAVRSSILYIVLLDYPQGSACGASLCPNSRWTWTMFSGLLGLALALRPKFVALALQPEALTLPSPWPWPWASNLGLVARCVIFFNRLIVFIINHFIVVHICPEMKFGDWQAHIDITRSISVCKLPIRSSRKVPLDARERSFPTSNF